MDKKMTRKVEKIGNILLRYSQIQHVYLMKIDHITPFF